MNAAILIMSSAALAGADPAPPPPPPAAPIVVSGGGCNNCAPAPSGCCGSSKAGFFDRLKGRLGGGGGLFSKKSHDCGCGHAAPAPCAPAPCAKPAPAPCPTSCAAPAPAHHYCSKSIADRPNLFDTLKSRWGSKKNSCCAPACDPCGASHLIVTPPPTGGTNPPKEMPKVDPKEKPKGGNSSGIPQPMPGIGIPAGANGSPY